MGFYGTIRLADRTELKVACPSTQYAVEFGCLFLRFLLYFPTVGHRTDGLPDSRYTLRRWLFAYIRPAILLPVHLSECITQKIKPRTTSGSAPALTLSRLARCSHYIAACQLADRLTRSFHRELQQLCYLRCRPACYRLERLPCRTGISPLKTNALSRRTIDRWSLVIDIRGHARHHPGWFVSVVDAPEAWPGSLSM